jgi:hypothetical protein
MTPKSPSRTFDVMKYLIVFFLFFTTQARAASAPPADFGLGLMVGTMISMTGKYWLDKHGALDFGVSSTGSRGMAVYADYLWHIPGIFGTSTRFGRETSGYVGGGGGVGFWHDSYECGRWGCARRSDDSGTGIFIRGLCGFEWYPRTTRFGVFTELGPTFMFAPSTGGSLDLGVGGRYYF